MNSIKIKNFIITENQRPMFVAEISGNHNQKLSNALKLIKRAKEAVPMQSNFNIIMRTTCL